MLPIWYEEYLQIIEKSMFDFLHQFYVSSPQEAYLESFQEAIFYALKGGKRLRSIFALEFYLHFSQRQYIDIRPQDDILKYCCALECLHAYSLIHDDLPCMDNDEYRRGELTVWKKYGEANAVLVGDLLNSLAFEIFSSMQSDFDIKPLMQYFGKAVGIHGMIGGQVGDLFYERHPEDITVEKLIEVHNKKTGALIEASIIGGILLSQKNISIHPYQLFAKKIGLAFQVKDDLLDIQGTQVETGKSVGGEKKGFVFLIGVEKTQQYLESLIKECESIIVPLKNEKLNFLVEYVQMRKK